MKFIRIAILAAASALIAQAPALAQDVVLDEIIVSATKRAQSEQDVPTALTVFSGNDLENIGVTEPRDLAEQTPGLLTKFGPNGLATVGFYIRGVGINDFTGTVDPSVGVYVDEVFKPTPDMLNFSMFDIQRVEVLKGPQGTLYGRNSTGGAVNIITASPTPEFEGFINAEYSRFVTGTITGAVSGPLSDTLMGRLSLKGQISDDDEGFSLNRTTGSEQGKNDEFAIRNQLLWEPNQNLDVRLVYGYGYQESDQPLLQHVGVFERGNIGTFCDAILQGRLDEANCVDALGFSDDDGNPHDGEASIDPMLRIESHEVSGTINWSLPRFTITSITSFEDFDKRQSQDIDASPFVAADNFTFSKVENFSQEIRFTSDESFPFTWIFGGNYGDTKINWFQRIDLTDLAGIPTSNGADQKTETWALFANIGVPIGDKFEVGGGIRFTHEERTWVGATFIGNFDTLDEAFASGAPILSQLPLPPDSPLAGGPLDFPNMVEEDNVDFQGTIKYRPNENTMLFARISEAFRSGGFSSAVLFSQAALEPFGPENLLAYEGGVKMTMADSRVRLNASAYFYDFEGFQATFIDEEDPNARLRNAGDVEIYGLDASIDVLPAEGLSLNFGISLLENKIVNSDVVLQQLTGGPPVSIEGNEIPNAPSVNLNGRARYETPVSNNWQAAFQTDFTYVSEHFLEPNNREVLSEDGYFLLNGRVSVATIDGKWEAAAWVKNLTDEDYFTSAQDIIFALGFAEMVVGRPRTWGFEVSRNF